MNRYDEVLERLCIQPKVWLITGVAGFIGSNLLEALLRLNQIVIGLDNFATGRRENLDDVRSAVGVEQWKRFSFFEGNVCDLSVCRSAVSGVDYVLHQAALGSVPRSIEDPLRSHSSNVDGFLNILIAARDASVQRFVFASSSSVYGDHPALPKVELNTGSVLSPYAATKLVNEVYAGVFSRCYDLKTVGLRYFNVFGPRQSPNGAYAAVIPRWFSAILRNQPICINGDGSTSRDFCYVDNVVQANILAAVVDGAGSSSVYNVACGQRTTLLDLHGKLRALVRAKHPEAMLSDPHFMPERSGDVRHSLADVTMAREQLGYSPNFMIDEGLERACSWYMKNLK